MKKISTIIVLVSTLILVGCSTHVHTVGKGPQTGEVVTESQWYAINGLYPLNEVDTAAMAGGATNYEIKTEMSVVDMIITYFTSAVTVQRRTVTVTK